MILKVELPYCPTICRRDFIKSREP